MGKRTTLFAVVVPPRSSLLFAVLQFSGASSTSIVKAARDLPTPHKWVDVDESKDYYFIIPEEHDMVTTNGETTGERRPKTSSVSDQSRYAREWSQANRRQDSVALSFGFKS